MTGWRELEPLGAQRGGDVGGDDQVSESWCRRFVKPVGDGEHAQVTVYFFLARRTGPDGQPEAELELTRQTEYSVCRTDFADRNDGETYANQTELVERLATWLTEWHARDACQNFDMNLIRWDGTPRSENECRVHVHPDGGAGHGRSQTVVTCLVHGSLVVGASREEFLCDKGHDWCFLVRDERSDRPLLRDVTGLGITVRAAVQAAEMGDQYTLTIRRWVDDDTVEPLTFGHVPGTGAPDEDGWCHPQYTVTGPDGREYLRTAVRLPPPD